MQSSVQENVITTTPTHRHQRDWGLLLDDGLYGGRALDLRLGLGLSLGFFGCLPLLVGYEAAAEAAVANADGGVGQAELLEADPGHVFGLVLGKPVVSHPARLYPDDGIYRKEDEKDFSPLSATATTIPHFFLPNMSLKTVRTYLCDRSWGYLLRAARGYPGDLPAQLWWFGSGFGSRRPAPWFSGAG